MKIKKNKYILYGPFIGEFLWELYYFIPHFIYDRKKRPKDGFIVITREENFDLYGVYADVLCKLNLQGDSDFKKEHFTIHGLPADTYDKICDDYIKALNKKYNIVETKNPKVHAWYNDIKWQFPRSETDYNFIPRKENRLIVNGCLRVNDQVIFNETEASYLGYRNIRKEHIDALIEKDKNVTFYGLIVEFLKVCKFYIGPFDSNICRLALLLGVPVITNDINVNPLELKLINPLDVEIIKTPDYREGVRIYENHIRS